MFAGVSEKQLPLYSSAPAIVSFSEQYGIMVQSLEQLQPFYKHEGQHLDLPRGSSVNEGRVDKQEKKNRALLILLNPLF